MSQFTLTIILRSGRCRHRGWGAHAHRQRLPGERSPPAPSAPRSAPSHMVRVFSNSARYMRNVSKKGATIAPPSRREASDQRRALHAITEPSGHWAPPPPHADSSGVFLVTEGEFVVSPVIHVFLFFFFFFECEPLTKLLCLCPWGKNS